MTLKLMVATMVVSLSAVASTPRVTGIAPQTLKPGPSAQQVTVIGEGFVRGLTLTVTSPAGQSQVYKDIEVQSQEEASFRVQIVLPVAGTYQFVVTNTDGGVSQPFKFDLGGGATPAATAPSTAPVIDAITPSKTSKQSQPQLLQFSGQRFVQGLVVTFNDPAGNDVRVSGNGITNLTSNSFTAAVVLTVEGEYTVTVTTPDGQVSNSASLSVRGE